MNVKLEDEPLNGERGLQLVHSTDFYVKGLGRSHGYVKSDVPSTVVGILQRRIDIRHGDAIALQARMYQLKDDVLRFKIIAGLGWAAFLGQSLLAWYFG
jgi:hypothetical protein